LWEYDDIIFDSVVRRSGGSLVITIPPELKKRFLLSEGQHVKLIGVVKKGLHIEGGILIYFGRFEIMEEALKITAIISKDGESLSNEDIRELTGIFDKYNLSNYLVNRVDESTIKIELIVSNISEEGILYITKDDIKRILKEIEKKGFIVKEIKEGVEEMVWHCIDPSILVRYSSELPKNIKVKWVLK